MRVLITGGAGFIGSHIAEYFQGKAEVRILDSLRSGFKKNLDGLDVEFIEGDIRDRITVAKAMEDVDYVFHLAAMISVPESMTKREEALFLDFGGDLRRQSGRAEGRNDVPGTEKPLRDHQARR